MKLKITSPGYGKFSGFMGGVLFENGVSVDDVSDAEARALGSIMRVESVDTGMQQGDAADLARNRHTPAGKIARFSKSSEQPAPSKPLSVPETPAAASEAPSKKYTKAELETIADMHGINGLREIGEPLGLRGRGIKELIDAIIDAQGK